MKKKYLLIIIVFLLSGCSAEYNLEFNDSSLVEKIKIGQIDSKYEEELKYLTPYSIINSVQQEVYDVDYLNNYLNLTYRYGTNNFGFAETFNKCYELSNLSYDDNYYYILTSKEFKCLSYEGYQTDEVTIKFKTNHKVISSNADYVDGSTYIWIIDENNSQNKPIEIKLAKETNNNDDEKKDNKKQENIFVTIAVALIFILILIGLYIRKKSKKINKT